MEGILPDLGLILKGKQVSRESSQSQSTRNRPLMEALPGPITVPHEQSTTWGRQHV